MAVAERLDQHVLGAGPRVLAMIGATERNDSARLRYVIGVARHARYENEYEPPRDPASSPAWGRGVV
jgi:hypothetical protein